MGADGSHYVIPAELVLDSDRGAGVHKCNQPRKYTKEHKNIFLPRIPRISYPSGKASEWYGEGYDA